jgi:hypothetical protein
MAPPLIRPRPLCLVNRLVLVGAVLTLAACGGSNDSSSDPSSANYDPAQTTLKAAGLEVCDDAEDQIPQTISSTAGLVNTRAFFVAKDCMGKKTSPNIMAVFQFDSRESVDAGARTIKSGYPRASVLQTGPLVVTATGPDREANLAAVEEQLKKQTSTTTESG